ncbi:hypothetical protein F5Y13DRAFT_185286 [Hypoxylon sp. FL1857]|nr:hypothetical protein F5Y13DRAFT_185286 [Hypoxylon sp. FL1857]
MGNIFGRPHVIYVTYEYYPRAANNHVDSDDSTSDDESYAPYGWGQFFLDLFCCPWFGGFSGTQREDPGGWNGAIIGIVRRKGCQIRDHWALAFRSGIDISQLPRRISGFRTRIPSRCRRICTRRQRIYVVRDSSSDGGSSVATDVIVVN